MSKTITIRLDEDKYQLFKTYAKNENRNLSNFIETATLKYIQDTEYVDDFEMDEILNNRELLKSLKKGFEDVKKGRGKMIG